METLRKKTSNQILKSIFVGISEYKVRAQQSLSFLMLTCFLAFVSAQFSHAGEWNGIVQFGYSYSDTDEPWLRSWTQKGTGITRYDSQHDGLDWQMIAIEYQGDIFDDTSFQVTALAYPDGDKRMGVSEAFIHYRPLTQGWRHQIKLGVFYPEFGFENPDTAWNSPYTYTFSALNTWVAEELRVIGAQWMIKTPKQTRRGPRKSNHFDFVIGAYTNNDPLGSILTWRGWAFSQRQSLIGERLEFAAYPSLKDPIPHNPSWVEPFDNIDDRIGIYAGTHWRFKRNSEVRLYYYDNFARETDRVEPLGQYAWDTQFLSLAWQYRFSQELRLQTQLLTGKTVMGRLPDRQYVVASPIDALYVMLSKRIEQHRVSLRWDRFRVGDIDAFPTLDNNRSDGYAFTAAWRYDINEHWQIGMEWLWVSSNNENREQWGWQTENEQNQGQLVSQYRF